MNKLPYTLDSLASLGSTKMVVDRYVPDDRIIFSENDSPTRDIESLKVTIWDLETGELRGNADISKANDMHVSPATFKHIQELTEKAEDL